MDGSRNACVELVPFHGTFNSLHYRYLSNFYQLSKISLKTMSGIFSAEILRSVVYMLFLDIRGQLLKRPCLILLIGK